MNVDEGIDIQGSQQHYAEQYYHDDKEHQPVAYVLNSDNISINNLKWDSAEVLAIVQNERSKSINILNTDVTKAKQNCRRVLV